MTRKSESSQDSQDTHHKDDVKSIRENLSLRSPVIYEIVRQNGTEELNRPLASLWWSGIAAGLGLSLSVFCEGILHAHLPDTGWRPLIENLGYPVGFLIVILGRLQLFTESTITAILPLLRDRKLRTLGLTARLWGVVFLANMLGCFFAALMALYPGVATEVQLEGALEVSRHLLDKSTLDMLLHGIPAGFIIAALVWCLPSSKGNEFWVIFLFTYVIALADLTHVVAGATEIFLLLLHGEIGIVRVLLFGLGPVFVGNVIGGTGLFALIAYAQVKEEL